MVLHMACVLAKKVSPVVLWNLLGEEMLRHDQPLSYLSGELVTTGKIEIAVEIVDL